MSQKRNILTTVVLLLLIVLTMMGLAIYQQWRVTQGDSGSDPGAVPDVNADNVYIYDEPRPIRAFSLLDEQGERVDNDLFRGRWTIAFVGFTHCPDICPTTMATLSKAADRISDATSQPRFLMISADPQRDTPEKLSKYVTFFGDDFRGLTGERETLKALANDLNATFSRSTGSDGEPEVQHSSHLSLISPGGDFVAMIRPPLEAPTIARVHEALQQWRPSTVD